MILAIPYTRSMDEFNSILFNYNFNTGVESVDKQALKAEVCYQFLKLAIGEDPQNIKIPGMQEPIKSSFFSHFCLAMNVYEYGGIKILPTALQKLRREILWRSVPREGFMYVQLDVSQRRANVLCDFTYIVSDIKFREIKQMVGLDYHFYINTARQLRTHRFLENMLEILVPRGQVIHPCVKKPLTDYAISKSKFYHSQCFVSIGDCFNTVDLYDNAINLCQGFGLTKYFDGHFQPANNQNNNPTMKR